MSQLLSTASRWKQGRRLALPVVAVVAVAMLGAVLTLASSAPSAQAQLANTTCYTINDGPGTMISWTGGSQTNLGSTGLSAVEALAANQDRNELWTFDNNTQTVYSFTPGSATPSTEFAFSSGDIDGLTWVNHTNGDPGDDELWGTYRNPVPNVNNGPNEADQIVRINPVTGAVISGPTDITDPGAGTNNEQDDNDGLIWDPQTGNFYGVIGGDSTANDLIIIDPSDGSISQIDLTLNGGDILDIESLGAGTDGQLYGTTGEDDVDANQFISINKLSGAVTVIGAFGGDDTNVDYEATACLTAVPFSVTPATCYAVDEGNGNDDNHLVQVDVAADGSITFTDLGVINNAAPPPGPVDARNIESVAYRNGFAPHALYTQDPATDVLIRINETDGTDSIQVANVDIGDIDGLTWRYDNDVDASNDELWGVVRNGGNPEDEIVQISVDVADGPIGSIVVGSRQTIQTGGSGTENDVDGLAWDPATDTFYSPVNGSSNDNDLITINPSNGAVTVIGAMGIEDVEGIGFTDAGELFGMTGDDGANPNTFLFIDKATGAATTLGPITIYADYESLDCAGVAPVAQPDLQIRLDVIPAGDPCPADYASATEDVGPVLPVAVGDDVTYCFKVINNGPGDATNVVVNHPALPAPLNLGDIAAGAEAMGMVDDTVEVGDGETTATVTGEDVVGDPVTPDSDPAAVAPVQAPVLDIRLDVVPIGDPCPVDFASATEGIGTPLPVELGDQVTYCFKVINNGPGDAQNVVVNHPLITAPFNLGDIAAGEEAMAMEDDTVEPGDGVTTATVDGESTLGDPVPQASDPAEVVPVEDPVLDIRLDVIPAGDPCPADYASATEDVGPVLPVAVGDDVTYCFKVINNGPGDATNVVVNHPALPAPLNLGDIAAGGEAMGMVDDTVEVGDGETTATVDGDNTLGNPVPQAEDPAAVDPVQPPVLDIRLDVIPAGDPCPADYASATEGDGPALPVFVGDDVTYCFKVINTGPDTAENVTVNHPALPAPLNLGTTPAGGEAMGMVDDVIEVGDGQTTATVDGDDRLGEPVPQAADTALVNPSDPIATIGNFVWRDNNRDGVQDPGEPGIQDVPVTVWTVNPDGSLGSVFASLTTDAIGEWGTNVPPGDYRVAFALPAGAESFSPPNVGDDALDSDANITLPETGFTGIYTVANGDDNQTIDAGIVFPVLQATLGNFVWEDTNGNGIQDEIDTGIQGILVEVRDSTTNGLVGSDTTDSNGEWMVMVDPGTYFVTFINTTIGDFTIQDVPGDDTIDSDADPTTGETAPVTVGEDEQDLTVDAGIVFPSPAIGLAKDLSDGPTRQGTSADYDVSYSFVIENLGDVELTSVTLLDNVAVGLAATTGSVVSGPTPNVAGDCSTAVLDGTQTLAVGASCTAVWDFVITNPGGAELAYDNSATVEGTPPVGPPVTDTSDDGTDPDPDGDGNPDEPGENDPTPALIPALASLGDKVWEDTNGNGIDDDGANGIAGVTVNLLDENSVATGQSTTTDADGLYGFADLDAGTYIVEVVPPADRDFTTQDVPGDDTIDSDVDPTTGQTGPIVLAPGDDDPTNDAGLTPLPIPVGSISDLVWEDTNGDGIQDAGEPGIAGVTVTLLDGNGDPIPGIDPVVTDGDGNYIFGELPEGDYIVAFTAPAGREFTTQDAGDGTNDSDAGTDGVTGVVSLGAGEDNVDVDAGIAPLLASLGDKVWEDTNGNGIDDDGANGIAGVTVNLLDENGVATGQSDVTDADGLYGFADLLAGTYIVEVVPPADRDFTTQDVPGDDTIDSDVDPTTGQTGPIVLAPGDDDPTNDAGIAPLLASLGDKVWEDTNGNGIDDDGANGIAGVTVNLLDENGVATGRFATTDADGLYGFADLLAGTYIVEVVPPADRDFTTQDVPGDDTIDSDVDPTTGQTGPIVLAPGDDDPTNDAGLTPLPIPVGSISDLVWEDTNGDGIQDAGEPGVAGVTVTLLDGNGDAIPGIDPVVTDGDGNYIFGELPEGDYIVAFTAPAGREFTTQDAGDGTNDSDAGTDGVTGVVSLGAGEDNVDVDAGLTPLNSAIGLAKQLTTGPSHRDDGAFDFSYTFIIENLGETELTDVTLSDNVAVGLVGTSLTLVSGPTPNAAGDCSTAVASGTQTLAVGDSCTAVWDFVIARGDVHSASFDNSAVVEGTPPVGPPVTDVSDDGTEPDTDGDGDGNEPGENDPTPATVPGDPDLSLDDPYVCGADEFTGELTAGVAPFNLTYSAEAVDGDPAAPVELGNFDVAGLGPFATPPGFIDPILGVDKDWLVSVVLTDSSGQALESLGLFSANVRTSCEPLGSIGNRVFLDENSDGIQDPGEPSVAGATVQLFEANADGSKGELVGTQTTPADGTYLFDDLPAGDYIIVVTPPAGFVVGPQDAGVDDDVDNDISPITGESAVITIGVGENLTNVDAGVVPRPGVPPVVTGPPANPQFEIPTITNAPRPDPVPAAVPPAPPLALTGSNSNVLATLAIAMMASGGTMMIGARRERDKE